MRNVFVLPSIACAILLVFPPVSSAQYISSTAINVEPPVPEIQRPGDQLEQLSLGYGCIDGRSGEPIQCRFELEKLGLASNQADDRVTGGHHHDDPPRPMTGLYSRLDEEPDDEMRIVGWTVNEGEGAPYDEVHKIEYEIMEVSGEYLLDARLELMGGWVCLNWCWDRYTRRVRTHVRTGFDLHSLECDYDHPGTPTPGACRSSDGAFLIIRGEQVTQEPAHKEAMHLRRLAKARLLLYASLYQSTYGEPLSINDLSLPIGGLFDLNGQWWAEGNSSGNGHYSHRDGRHADFNSRRQDGSRFECRSNRWLREQVRESNYVLSGSRNLSGPIHWSCSTVYSTHLTFVAVDDI